MILEEAGLNTQNTKILKSASYQEHVIGLILTAPNKYPLDKTAQPIRSGYSEASSIE